MYVGLYAVVSIDPFFLRRRQIGPLKITTTTSICCNFKIGAIIIVIAFTGLFLEILISHKISETKILTESIMDCQAHNIEHTLKKVLTNSDLLRIIFGMNRREI